MAQGLAKTQIHGVLRSPGGLGAQLKYCCPTSSQGCCSCGPRQGVDGARQGPDLHRAGARGDPLGALWGWSRAHPRVWEGWHSFDGSVVLRAGRLHPVSCAGARVAHQSPRSRLSSSHVWPTPAIRLLSTRGGPCLEGPLTTGTVASSFFTLCHECTCEAEPKGRGPRPPSRYVLVTCDLGPWPSLGSSPRPPGCGEPAIEGLCSLLSPLRLGSCAGGSWVFSSHLEIKIAL